MMPVAALALTLLLPLGTARATSRSDAAGQARSGTYVQDDLDPFSPHNREHLRSQGYPPEKIASAEALAKKKTGAYTQPEKKLFGWFSFSPSGEAGTPPEEPNAQEPPRDIPPARQVEIAGDRAEVQAELGPSPAPSAGGGVLNGIGLSASAPNAQPAAAPTLAPERQPELYFPPFYARELVAGHPTDPAANYVAGFQAAWGGDHESAMPYYRRAVEGGREDPRTLAFASLSAYHTGDMQHAADWAGRSFAADPAGELAPIAESVHKLASKRLPAGPEPTAAKAADRPAPDSLSELPPVLPPGRSEAGAFKANSALHAEAKAAMEVRDYKRAVSVTSKALEADPDDARARFIRAAAEVRRGDYAAAGEDARKGLEVAHGFAPFLLIRSLADARQGRYAEAREGALSVLRADARNAAAMRVLALSEAGLGERERMLATLALAARGDPSAAAVLARARTLPSDADATLLFSDAFLLGEGAAPAPPQAPARRGLPKWAVVALACAVAGGVAWGLIMLAGRRDAPTPRWAPPPGDAPAEDGRVGPYRLLAPLGAGGMGVVWKAQDTRLERLVALKRMREEIAADPRERERFLQEARIVSALDHPGIVRIWGIEEGAAGTFLVFELVEGETLSEVLGRRGRLPAAEARALLGQACAAVAYAHAKGVVHRDLKPSNIMLDAGGRVRVMDFGVARAAKDALTRLTAQGTVAGTPAYMAPEQEEGRSGPASDVYALGVCLYEMLAGRLPYEGSGVALYQAKRQGRLPPLGSPLDEVLAKALHPDPAARYAGPSELAAALGAVPA